MREMKRILAMALALALLVGILPMSVFADEYGTAEGTFSSDTVLDAAIFCSDVHGSTSDLEAVLGGIKTSGVDYSSIGFVGDTCLTVANTTSVVQSALGDTNISVMFSYAASHDTEDGADISTNWNYSGEVEGVSDYYLVYTIRETDMQTASAAETAAPAFSTWYNSLTAAQKALPIFIMSHRPLHDGRGDNLGAAEWYTVITAAAKTSDIVVFWGHNHTSETQNKTTEVDQAAYYVPNDGTETITIANNGGTTGLNFTYMNAGYINANNQSPKRIGVATTVKITASSLIFQDYNSSGEYSGTYAHNVTVTREFVSVPKTLAVTGKIDYTVGDPIVDPTAVEVTYVDVENPETITTGYSLTKITKGETEYTVDGFTFPEAGTYNLTYTCKIGNYQADAILQVTAEAAVTAGTASCWDDTEQVYIEVATPGVTAVTATNVTGENAKYDEVFTASGHVAFDIKLTGYTDGNDVEYSISVVPDMDTTNLELYYVDAEGNLIPVEFELVSDELNNLYVVFTTSYVGTFVYGSAAVPEGYTISSLTLAGIPADVFEGIGVDMTEAVITATYTKDGAEDFVRVLTIYDYDENNWSYQDEVGTQVFTFTFEGKTATMDIYVWYDEFVVGGEVTVHVGDEEYGVTGANVATSSNNNVAAAIASVIKSGTYVAYDITLSYADGYEANTNIKTVTLPIPENVTNPVVYYVSEDGATVTNMNATDNGDGTVTFTTTHFSTYVIGESTEIEVPDPTIAENVTSTTTTTIYQLVSSLTVGEEYLIVSRNSAGSGYGLAGSASGVSVTVKAADDVSSVVYIDDKGSALEWTASDGWAFTSGSYNLGYSNGLSFSTEDAWTFYNNRLYQSVSSGNRNSTYYLRCNNGTWSASTSRSNVYFYQKVEVGTTTTGDYSIKGENVSTVLEGSTTADLSYTITFTPDGGTATTVTNLGGTATWSIVTVDANDKTVDGDPNNIISGFNGNTVTFTGNHGKALVKVTYTWTVGEGEEAVTYTIDNYITIEAKAPYYTVEIDQGDSHVEKGVADGTTHTLDLSATVKYYGTDSATGSEVENPTLAWEILEGGDNIATIDASTGLLTFNGNEGTIEVQVTYTAPNGATYYDVIRVIAQESTATTPDESTTDFPRWPNDGAVRFDKTATAVGNFSETGIAQVELTLAGIPAGGAKPFDVVIMLDTSNSMDTSDRMTYAISAAQAFVNKITLDDDGNWNGLQHGISICYFNDTATTHYPSSTQSSTGMIDITSSTIRQAVYDSIATVSQAAGTSYLEALKHAQKILADNYDPDRDQYLIFLSDGAPSSYSYISDSVLYTSSNHTETTVTDGYTAPDGTKYDVQHVEANGTGGSYQLTTANSTGAASLLDVDEYYSTLMKDAGVEIYSVGLAISDSTAKQYISNISSAADNESDTANNSHTFFVNDNDSSALTNAFVTIGEEMMAAASNIEVTDKITDEYEMIFDWPTAVADANKVTGQEFYIEVVNYTLDNTTHERTGASEVLLRIYLTKDSSGNLSISKLVSISGITSTSTGTETTLTTDPVYTAVGEGEKGYFNLVDGAYVYVADGTGTYNMTAGATVSGTADTVVIHTPYFSYDANTKIIKWHVSETGETTEIALRYFLYLTGSLESVAAGKNPGEEGYVAPGTYPTNEYATLEYTNFRDVECMQYFPEPQLTWNGAQVSYVFYLVNEYGQPVNRAGRVVTFAEAIFVTDIHTISVVWNDEEGVENLLAEELVASGLLPDSYTLYDDAARYEIHVYENESGYDLGNYFTIGATTKVDSDGNSSTMVYNTKAGTKYAAPGTYASQNLQNADVTVINGFDFANTTVAFAVVWEKKLTEDTVVVDFGLPVDIDVVSNDFVYNYITGIGATTTVPTESGTSVVINEGTYTTSQLTSQTLTVNGHSVKVQGENYIRFTPGSMEFNAPVTFYYETKVETYEGGQAVESYMYSKVTVIPATTIYYEDSFISDDDLKTYEWDATANDWKEPTTGIGTGDFDWKLDGTEVNGTQDQDRPGESQISAAIDADNNYGYDSAYSEMSKHSMGAALKVHVDYDHMATASFSFYGTGFDVISLTDNTTGTIVINVYDSNNEQVRSHVVNTYYGYTYTNGEWVTTDSANPNAIYQVPVMKISELPYGKYTAEIKVVYDPIFDQGLYDNASFDFYLDAIRIYDPCGTDVVVDDNGTPDDTTDDVTVGDIYVQDGEGWPEYTELRNMVLAAEALSTDDDSGTTLEGVVFIDGISGTSVVTDYTNYGPNNELYLANGQSIAFDLNAATTIGAVASIQLGIKSVGGTGQVTITGGGTAYDTLDIKTATDMYYDITKLNGKTVVITSTGDAIISLTNIKVTYTEAQTTAAAASEEVTVNSTESTGYSLMSLRSSASAISTMATAAETVEAVETETYLLSVNAETVAYALQVLNAEEEVEDDTNTDNDVEEDVEPEEPTEPEIPETPEEPTEPEIPEKPEKPEDHRKPGKGHHGKGHGKYHRKKFDDQPGSDHGRRGH